MKRTFFTALLAAVFLCAGACKNKAEDNKAGAASKNMHTDEGMHMNGMHSKSAAQPAEEKNRTTAQTAGKQIYTQNCAVCHQAGGSGVPQLNPPLQQTKYVLGQKDSLISILLKGSSASLTVKGTTYSNTMPSFSSLSNEQIANVLSYVRNSFGNHAEEISAAEVQKVRENLK